MAAPCYKRSTIPCYPKEVLMPILPRPLRAIQLPLFQSGPGAPRWEQLPSEVRQQATRVLARMLGEHAERRMVCVSMPEASDE